MLDIRQRADAPPDSVLARRAGMGDRGAFTELFERHGAATFRYALHMLDGHVQDSEDAVQSAWIKVWQHIESFRGESELRTWLFRITAGEVTSARRRRRPVPVSDDLLTPAAEREDLEPPRQLAEAQLREALAVALSELPWRQRASWLLFEFEELSYQEIADVLGTSPTVVRGQLHRARRSLAIRMAQWR